MFRLVAVVFALGVLGGIAYFFFETTTVDVIVPRRGPAVEAVYATGVIESQELVPIALKQGAKLTAIHVHEGEVVEAETLLASLDLGDLESSVAEQVAQAEEARAELQRLKHLLSMKAAAEPEVTTAAARVEAREAALARARALLAQMQIRSPAKCRVVRKEGEVGEFITANRPLLYLDCSVEKRITAEVDEEEIPRVKIGQKVLAMADAFPGRVFHGEVRGITPKGDSNTRSFRVRMACNDSSDLMLGMSIEVNIIISEIQDALLVPSSVLYGESVWRVVAGRAQRTKVAVGVRGGDVVQILQGVDENDRIILRPEVDLKEATRLKTSEVSW
jgi:RND family efflux transporter MFP subunit